MRAKAEQLPELASTQYSVQELPTSYNSKTLRAYNSKTLKASCINPLKASSINSLKASQRSLNDQPLSLLAHPQKLTQRAKQPYLQGPLSIIHGPDRLSSHWWDTLQSRDYFIARQRNGRLLWVFYDRVQKAWFLHGLFC